MTGTPIQCFIRCNAFSVRLERIMHLDSMLVDWHFFDPTRSEIEAELSDARDALLAGGLELPGAFEGPAVSAPKKRGQFGHEASPPVKPGRAPLMWTPTSNTNPSGVMCPQADGAPARLVAPCLVWNDSVRAPEAGRQRHLDFVFARNLGCVMEFEWHSTGIATSRP